VGAADGAVGGIDLKENWLLALVKYARAATIFIVKPILQNTLCRANLLACIDSQQLFTIKIVAARAYSMPASASFYS
jgi:hypothetical protein